MTDLNLKDIQAMISSLENRIFSLENSNEKIELKEFKHRLSNLEIAFIKNSPKNNSISDDEIHLRRMISLLEDRITDVLNGSLEDNEKIRKILVILGIK